jgi:exodeoxyribonuclease VII small subunit
MKGVSSVVAKKTPKSNEADEPRYEALIDQLETIVDRIESGEIGLEESIKGYEEGIGLIKRARTILDRAEQRIVELNADELDAES